MERLFSTSRIFFHAYPSRLIKSEDQEWSPAVIFSLLSNLRFDAHFGTFDADAIETALNLASISQSRGPKTVFVLTDGYGTRGSLFVKALQRAENEGVEVIGVSVGFSKTLVSEVYQHYIVAAFPSVLPDALQAYAEQETEGEEEKEKLDETNISLADARDTVDSVLADMMTVFPKLHEQMRGERDLKLVKGNAPSSSTTVDLCFVIDCTGSMAPYLQAVIAQVKGLYKVSNFINFLRYHQKPHPFHPREIPFDHLTNALLAGPLS